jgi:hypothetical protein
MEKTKLIHNRDGSIIEIDSVTGKMKRFIRSHLNESDVNQMGYFGNIWVRSHTFVKAGDTHDGHKHNFDHVTLLAVGSVLVEAEGNSPKEFHAPTFIVIDKDHNHKFTAMSDGVVYYCVFALRDLDGEVTNIYTEENSPLGPKFANMTDEEIQKQILKLRQEK